MFCNIYARKISKVSRICVLFLPQSFSLYISDTPPSCVNWPVVPQSAAGFNRCRVFIPSNVSPFQLPVKEKNQSLCCVKEKNRQIGDLIAEENNFCPLGCLTPLGL